MRKYIISSFLLLILSFPALASDQKETSYERVMRTQTIRCGYGQNKPMIYQDLNTGEMKGVNADIIKAVAEVTGLKLEWPEEVGWIALPESLKTGRVDVACSAFWIDPKRGMHVSYTKPIFYQPIYLYAREDDERFTGDIAEINSKDIKISAQEGDISYELAKRNFPEATIFSMPQDMSPGELFLNVTTGKADITPGHDVMVRHFNENNEKKLKRIPTSEPLVVYGTALAVGIQENELKELLDASVTYLLNTGRIEKITEEFRKEYPDAIILPKKAY